MSFNINDKLFLKKASEKDILLKYRTAIKVNAREIFIPFLDFKYVYDKESNKLKVNYQIKVVNKPYIKINYPELIIYPKFKGSSENYVLMFNEYFYCYEEACDSLRKRAECFVQSLDEELTKLFEEPKVNYLN